MKDQRIPDNAESERRANSPAVLAERADRDPDNTEARAGGCRPGRNDRTDDDGG